VTPDFDALAAIHAEAFADAGPRAWSAAEIAALAAAPGGDLATGRAEPPVGFALWRVAADEAELLTIAVRPSARRRGVGAALLAEAMARSRARGATRMLLEAGVSNAAALTLYRRAGFAEVGRRPGYHGAGQAHNALIMSVFL
jgi:ribosomal-protein-alanine N-acetyltransferase